jgi:hypothetical protein
MNPEEGKEDVHRQIEKSLPLFFFSQTISVIE